MTSRRVLVLLVAVAAFSAACISAGASSSGTTSSSSSTTTSTPVPSTTSAPSSSSSPSTSTTSTSTLPPTTTTTTNPAGNLPQTETFPSATSPQFRTEMADLWRAITTGKPADALPAFFPVNAYTQLKAIPDASGDWTDRLLVDFDLDIAAAHAYLGSSASHARLVSVEVASSDASWIPPGYCYNSIGYWHAPGNRLVYSVDGQVRSIGIASLISWRGEWYVVHLGAVLRSTDSGIVDSPTVGTGELGPPGSC